MAEKVYIFDVKPKVPDSIPNTSNVASTIIKQSHHYSTGQKSE